MEVESVAPLVHTRTGPDREHTERWFLFAGVDAGATEESLDKAISPLVSKTAESIIAGSGKAEAERPLVPAFLNLVLIHI